MLPKQPLPNKRYHHIPLPDGRQIYAEDWQ